MELGVVLCTYSVPIKCFLLHGKITYQAKLPVPDCRGIRKSRKEKTSSKNLERLDTTVLKHLTHALTFHPHLN